MTLQVRAWKTTQKDTHSAGDKHSTSELLESDSFKRTALLVVESCASAKAVQVLIRLQRIHRIEKPYESSAFMCHLLQHQYIITQQRTHMEWSIDWGQGSLLPAYAQTPALWLSPAEDFASPLLSTDVEMNKAWNSRSFLCLRALSGFHSDSWMLIFTKLKGFYDWCNSVKWGWNQPAGSCHG